MLLEVKHLLLHLLLNLLLQLSLMLEVLLELLLELLGTKTRHCTRRSRSRRHLLKLSELGLLLEARGLVDTTRQGGARKLLLRHKSLIKLWLNLLIVACKVEARGA